MKKNYTKLSALALTVHYTTYSCIRHSYITVSQLCNSVHIAYSCHYFSVTVYISITVQNVNIEREKVNTACKQKSKMTQSKFLLVIVLQRVYTSAGVCL